MLPEDQGSGPIGDDEVVQEVRRYREAHAASFDYDLERIFEDIKAREQASGRRLVKLPPKVLQADPKPAA
jgi:hypothetical protein